jgi:hypothetical protein
MTRVLRLVRPVAVLVVAAAALTACAGTEREAAEVTAAPTEASTQQPVVAGSGTTAPRVGPVQSIISPPPPVTTSAPVPTSGSGTASGPADPAGFTWSSRTPSAADLGSSWRDGCPVGPSSLRWVSFSHYDMAGAVRTGTLVIHRDIEAASRKAFASLFTQRFPIQSALPVSEFGSDDDASMAANNTSAFNCRYAVTNPPSTTWSNHAYGRAIDVNPRTNPYVLAGEVLPPNGAEFADRDRQHQGGLYRGGAALKAFTSNGFEWGGAWRNPDYQHLER